MTFECPKCGRYGMEWDGRAKVLMCSYSTCRCVIRMPGQVATPSEAQVLEAIRRDRE